MPLPRGVNQSGTRVRKAERGLRRRETAFDIAAAKRPASLSPEVPVMHTAGSEGHV